MPNVIDQAHLLAVEKFKNIAPAEDCMCEPSVRKLGWGLRCPIETCEKNWGWGPLCAAPKRVYKAFFVETPASGAVPQKPFLSTSFAHVFAPLETGPQPKADVAAGWPSSGPWNIVRKDGGTVRHLTEAPPSLQKAGKTRTSPRSAAQARQKERH